MGFHTFSFFEVSCDYTDTSTENIESRQFLEDSVNVYVYCTHYSFYFYKYFFENSKSYHYFFNFWRKKIQKYKLIFLNKRWALYYFSSVLAITPDMMWHNVRALSDCHSIATNLYLIPSLSFAKFCYACNLSGPVWYMCLKIKNFYTKIFVKICIGKKIYWNK